MPPVTLPFPAGTYLAELYDQLTPLAYNDAKLGYPLYTYLGAIASMFEQIETYARDQPDGTPGWGILLDIDRCPVECLQWLGQFVGEQVPDFPALPNLLTNTGFEVDISGWVTSGNTHLTAGATLTRVTTQNHSGVAAGQIVTTATANEGLANVFSGVFAVGVPVTANFWLKGNAGGEQVTILLGANPLSGSEFNSKTVTLTNAWQMYTVTWTPTVAATSAVVVVRNPAASVMTFFVDDVWANFASVTIESTKRLQVRQKKQMGRGTLQSMIDNASRYLIGAKTVLFKERDSGVSAVAGGAYGITVITYANETPDSAAVLAALLEKKPAGIILTYATVTGATYLQHRTTYATYTAMKAAFVTYTGLRNNVPGT